MAGALCRIRAVIKMILKSPATPWVLRKDSPLPFFAALHSTEMQPLFLLATQAHPASLAQQNRDLDSCGTVDLSAHSAFKTLECSDLAGSVLPFVPEK